MERVLLLAVEPRPTGSQKLKGDPGYRIRIGDWRVIYMIEDRPDCRVLVVRVKRRNERTY
jgi:mRNA interferase RelE/StbE